jgi:ABC-type transport system involved in multi-copper enzyme maturation permease subunit
MPLTQLPASVYRAIIRREVTTTLHNQFVQIFAALLLAGGGATALLSGRPEAVPFDLLLLFLYVVPLFGLLIGVSAAHEEHDERAFLWSQPVPRAAFVLGKAATLIAALALVLLLPLVPAAVAAPSVGALTLLWGLGTALVAVSVSAGVAVGQYTTSRARGLMAVLVVWFGAFALYDTLALVGAGIEVLQGWPALWVGGLLVNLIDAVRLAGLFGLENVPFAAPGEATWIADLAAWLPAWVAVLTVAWTALLLTLACRRLRRMDL